MTSYILNFFSSAFPLLYTGVDTTCRFYQVHTSHTFDPSPAPTMRSKWALISIVSLES